MQIVLYGTSSTGKTSLAKALQTIFPKPLLHIEADRFAPTVAPEYLAQGDADFRSRFVVAMHEAIAAFGRSGIDTVVDGSLPTELGLRDRCIAILRSSTTTKLVSVRCSAERLRLREVARGDRPIGWPEKQLLTIFEGLEFDLNLETTSGSAEDWARSLLHDLFPN